MGSSGGSSSQPVVQAEQPVTPAVARAANAGAAGSNEMQTAARNRMRGISSTYNRFAASSDGTSSKLG